MSEPYTDTPSHLPERSESNFAAPSASTKLAATNFGLCVGPTAGAAGRPEASGGDGGGKNTFRSLKLRENLYDCLEAINFLASFAENLGKNTSLTSDKYQSKP